MNAVTLVFGLAGIFTILSIILFIGKVYKRGKIGKGLTTVATCIAFFFVFGSCGIIPAKQQIISYHNQEINKFYQQCKKNPDLKSLEYLENHQISEYVYVEDFSVSKDGNGDIIKADFKITLIYGLYITTSDKVDLATVEVWE